MSQHQAKTGDSVTIVYVYNPTERKPDCSVIDAVTKQRCPHKAEGVLRFDESGVEVAICQECFDARMKEHKLN